MDLNLTDQQIERYARHLVLPEIGEEGQARLLASRGERVASLTHRGIGLDDAGRQILQALDGNRDSASVIDYITHLAKSGSIVITGPDGKRATDPTLIRRAVTKSVQSALPQFAKLGLLQA